jgi:hypothetical protein
VDTLAALVASAAEARDAFAAGDMDGSAAALDRLDARSRQAREHLRRANTGNVSADLEVEDPPEDAGDGESSLPTEVPLPPVRLPWALVLGPPGVESADRVAEALSVDLATARSLAHSPHSRIALRSGDAAALEARAARAREAGFRAVVVARETLAERPALAALAFSAGAWRATPEPLWLLPPDPGRAVSGEMLDGARVILVCPGEVEVRAHREERARSRWLRGGFHAEAAAAARRVLVVDLHTAEGIVRVVEGVTVLDGLPGYDPSSAIKSIRGLVEAAAEAFPGARVEGRRACGIGPTAPSAHDLVRDTGWPQWEEHTRAARAAWV